MTKFYNKTYVLFNKYNNNNAKFILVLLHLISSLLKPFGNLLHQPCHTGIEGVHKVDPSMMLQILSLTLAAFLLVEEKRLTGGNHQT